MSSKEEIQNLSAEERLNTIYSIKFITETARNAFRSISHHIKSCQLGFPPKGLVVFGPAGSGKTDLCKTYIEKNTDSKKENIIRNKFPYVHMSAESSINSTVDSILFELSLFRLERKTKVFKFEFIIKELIRRKTQCLFFDDFERLSDMIGRGVLDVCHMIRLLSEKANLPIILIGTPEILQILNTSPQMGIFASQKIELAPLNWNHRKQRLDFRRLLYDVEKLLPFMEPSNLSHESIASFIHRSTGGNIGRVMNLVKTAGRLAIENGCSSIDRNLLEEAHRRFEWPILNYKNPFQEKSLLPDYNRYLRSRFFRHKSKGGQSADGPPDSYGV